MEFEICLQKKKSCLKAWSSTVEKFDNLSLILAISQKHCPNLPKLVPPNIPPQLENDLKGFNSVLLYCSKKTSQLWSKVRPVLLVRKCRVNSFIYFFGIFLRRLKLGAQSYDLKFGFTDHTIKRLELYGQKKFFHFSSQQRNL